MTATVTTRVDEEVKKNAAKALGAMGLTLSGAVNMFLTRVAADGAIPFEVRVPNATTRNAMEEADELAAGRAARFADAREMIEARDAGRKQ